MGNARNVIAIVDDDEGVRRALRRMILSLAHAPVTFASGEEFLDGLAGASPDCAILDLHLPALRGIEVLERLRAEGSMPPVIIVTGLDQPGMRERCLGAGAAAYLTKPLGSADVSAEIEAILGNARHVSQRGRVG